MKGTPNDAVCSVLALLISSSSQQDNPLLCRAGPARCFPHMWGPWTLCWPGYGTQVLFPLHGGEPYGRKLISPPNPLLFSCILRPSFLLIQLYPEASEMVSFMLQPVSPRCVNLLFSQGGDLGNMTDAHMPRLYLLQWLKSDRALMMLFNDGTFQVNTWKTQPLLKIKDREANVKHKQHKLAHSCLCF